MKTNQKQEQRALSVEMAQQGRTWSQKLPWEVWRWPGAVRGAGPGARRCSGQEEFGLPISVTEPGAGWAAGEHSGQRRRCAQRRRGEVGAVLGEQGG